MSWPDWSWKMPRSWPTLSVMLDELGNPPAAVLARSFGVSVGTVKRWLRDDRAPRAVQLAVYWLTSWGRQEVHAEAEQAARLHAALYEALRRENLALSARIAYLEKVGDFGSVNAPYFVQPRLKVWR